MNPENSRVMRTGLNAARIQLRPVFQEAFPGPAHPNSKPRVGRDEVVGRGRTKNPTEKGREHEKEQEHGPGRGQVTGLRAHAVSVEERRRPWQPHLLCAAR